MKGAIFIALNDMVEEVLGIETWEKALHKAQPASQGIYTSTDSYTDKELFDIVQALSEITELDASVLVKQFGTFLFSFLNGKYPMFAQQQSCLSDFLQSIDKVIHKEVRKLYEDPSLPNIDCQVVSDNELMMIYRSQRKLCALAEGLVEGAAEYYGHGVNLTHDKCMHDGEEHCEIGIEIV